MQALLQGSLGLAADIRPLTRAHLTPESIPVGQVHTLGIAKDRNPAGRSRGSAGCQGKPLCPCAPRPCPAPRHSPGAVAAAVPPVQALAPSAQPEPVIDVPAEAEEQILPRREEWELPRPLGGTRARGCPRTPGLLPCKAPAQGCSPGPTSTEPGPGAPPGCPQPPHTARSPSLTMASSSLAMAREAFSLEHRS